MHSIGDTVPITSDEIPRDLLGDRKIIRFRVIIRFGLTPASAWRLLVACGYPILHPDLTDSARLVVQLSSWLRRRVFLLFIHVFSLDQFFQGHLLLYRLNTDTEH